MLFLEYLRHFRIGQFAIFDTVVSYIGILILSPALTWLMSKLNINVPTISWLWFTMPLAVIFHVFFQQNTPLMKILADLTQPKFYIALVILLGMVYMGFRDISRISSL